MATGHEGGREPYDLRTRDEAAGIARRAAEELEGAARWVALNIAVAIERMDVGNRFLQMPAQAPAGPADPDNVALHHLYTDDGQGFAVDHAQLQDLIGRGYLIHGDVLYHPDHWTVRTQPRPADLRPLTRLAEEYRRHGGVRG